MGFLAAAAVLVLTPLVLVDGVFLVAMVLAGGFAPAGEAPAAFFSPTLAVFLGAAATAAVFLEGAEAGVLFLSKAGVGVFFATPFVWGLDTPFDRRLWDVLGRDPGADLVWLGFVLAGALLVVLALGSAEVLLLVLAAGVSLAFAG